jgi:hypothetical protein
MDRGVAGGQQVLQVVSGDGDFNTAGVEQFVKDTGVEAAGVGYTVVAIMGPQSSGKSTLLNNLVRGGTARTCNMGAMLPMPHFPIARAIVSSLYAALQKAFFLLMGSICLSQPSVWHAV